LPSQPFAGAVAPLPKPKNGSTYYGPFVAVAWGPSSVDGGHFQRALLLASKGARGLRVVSRAY
jgi:hypothetical protein